jgi:Alpha/beta hydrolase domain
MQKQAKISGPVSGGSHGWPFGAPDPAAIEARGYVMEEFFLEGTAQRYRAKPGTTPGTDGKWETEPSETLPYKTRMYVVRPRDPAKFNGVLHLNWQNVTANVDLGSPIGDEIFRGYAWAGISAQKIAIDGVPGLTKGLAAWDPERYGALHHPGDAYSYDIYAQGARALRDGPKPGEPDPLGGLRPKTLLAAGGSQSSIRLGAYINIAHQHDRLFDGFFLIVHWGMCTPIEDISLQAQFAELPNGLHAAASRVNDRGDVPVLVLATECEAFDNYPMRQPDTDTFRFWEIAGATHADIVQAKEMTRIMTRDGVTSPLPPVPHPNVIPYDYVRDASLRWLARWVLDKTAPPRFPVINIETKANGRPAFQRDENGNATGGLRLPEMAAATGVHKGKNKLNPYQALSGESLLFSNEDMKRIHKSRENFLAKWDRTVDELFAAELALPAEAREIRERGRAIWS